jgi:hypothetical protein
MPSGIEFARARRTSDLCCLVLLNFSSGIIADGVKKFSSPIPYHVPVGGGGVPIRRGGREGGGA